MKDRDEQFDAVTHWLLRVGPTDEEHRAELLKHSKAGEAELLSKAWSGDKEAMREAFFLAWFSMRRGTGRLSPAMQDWFWDAIGPLATATMRGEGKQEIAVALGCLGYEAPGRGRPAEVTNDELERRLQIVAAVNVIAQHTPSKDDAVNLVATAVNQSESAVWGYCRRLAKVQGLHGELALSIAKPILSAAGTIAKASPLSYSKELRDFLAVTLGT